MNCFVTDHHSTDGSYRLPPNLKTLSKSGKRISSGLLILCLLTCFALGYWVGQEEAFASSDYKGVGHEQAH